jgi:hypothetical protein
VEGREGEVTRECVFSQAEEALPRSQVKISDSARIGILTRGARSATDRAVYGRRCTISNTSVTPALITRRDCKDKFIYAEIG